jgi:hypothetical protein
MGGGLSDAQLRATQVASGVVSVLSFLGSSFILLCYARFASLRKFSFTLVAILSATDVGSQVFSVLVSPSPAELDAMAAGAAATPLCLAQAIGSSYFELSSVLWTTAIAATLYLFVFKRMAAEAVERLLPLYALVCVGAPLLLALLPLADASYGPSGAWCWVRPERVAWVFAQFYAPMWIAVAFNATVYVGTRRLLLKTVEASSASGELAADETALRLRRLIERLQLYPAILVVVWTFASVNRVYEAATGSAEPVFALLFLARTFSASQGALNALAYGFSDGVRGAVRDELAMLCPRLVRRAEDPVAAGIGIAGRNALGGGTGAVAAISGLAAVASPAQATFASRSAAAGAERERLAAAGDGAGDDDDADDVRDLAVVVPPPRSIAVAVAAAAVATENPAGQALESQRRDRVALALSGPRVT